MCEVLPARRWNPMHKSSKRKNFSPTAAEEHQSTLRVAVSHQLTTVQQADAVAQKAQVAPGTDEDQKYISKGEKKICSISVLCVYG